MRCGSRSPQEVIDAIRRPGWCVDSDRGRVYWELVCAAIRNDVEAIGEHLGRDPDCARLEFWYTPAIHFAVREGNLEATRLLWEAHAHEDVTSHICTADDRGHSEVADYLRDAVGAVEAADLRLHEAAEGTDPREVERLLEESPALAEARDPGGRTALHQAVIAGNRAVVDALLGDGLEVDAVDHLGFRPAHYACWDGTYWRAAKNGDGLLSVLLDAGASDSPTLAAYRGDLGTLRNFVEADPAAANDGDTSQKRPVSAAVEGDHREVVRYLLDQGADPKLPEGRDCPYGSALMTATLKEDLELVAWLLDAGADPNGGIDSSGTPTTRAGSDAMRGLLYAHGGRPMPAWGYAQQGELDTLASILRYCDDPFSDEDSEYLTTPYTAVVSGCARQRDKGESTDAHEALLQMFLRRGHPMPTVLTECKSYLYHVPKMTRQLLEHGLDPNLPDWLGHTPLHDLCGLRRRHVDAPDELIRLFLEYGADIDAVDEDDRSTPLGIAAREGSPELVELLLENGADPNGCGEDWARPLVWAERRGHQGIAETLRARGGS
ncbi:MAG: ankyrin repeat domain-containing protein [Candidatus Latescibacteria bacterium]|nr:ankyrin repeat domain-containing protein [Candidatus Latescibacterota bacterium]